MIESTHPAIAEHRPASSILALARCLDCDAMLAEAPACPQCGRTYAFRDGVLEAIGPLSGRNRIVAEFYDGPGWKKFEPWERMFLWLQGGARKARMEILRHVLGLKRANALCLEVGIGSGENLKFLPSGWVVHGIDIARAQLQTCVQAWPSQRGRLAWAEAEQLPFPDGTFDACWSVGGFNYYRDHEQALREMRRVTRPGGPVVVADEIPNLHRAGIGHLLGVPSFDAWWLRKLGLDPAFASMVLEFDVDLEAVTRMVWPQAVRHRIWHGLGYCIVDTSDS
jgi:ubiquinone/menaquinone biosynthesis C-methylase UbiE